MASPKNREKTRVKKKTRQGNSSRTKYGRPGAEGGNKTYRKKYRGQGKGR